MYIYELRGKQANTNRWEALKLCDWINDNEVIQKILSITNPRFFSSRTPKEIIKEVRQKIEFDRKINEIERMNV